MPNRVKDDQLAILAIDRFLDSKEALDIMANDSALAQLERLAMMCDDQDRIIEEARIFADNHVGRIQSDLFLDMAMALGIEINA